MTETPPELTRFQACLPFTLKQECPHPENWSNPHNFSNDRHDPGGATMCGIIQREYDIYRKHHNLPVRSVRLITREEGEEIYETSYWLPDCPNLPPGLDLCFFDESVNAGPHTAIKILQLALGLIADGEWGAQTSSAVRSISNVHAVINAFTGRRETYYRSLATFRYFGTDWIRRSQEIGAAALKMAA